MKELLQEMIFIPIVLFAIGDIITNVPLKL